jgi:thiamine-monophosphate kinase
VVTTDLLIENVHFDLSYAPLKHLGYKAVVVNLNVYAMNANYDTNYGINRSNNRFPLGNLRNMLVFKTSSYSL